MNECMSPSCTRPVYCRGVCRSCYYAARRLIKNEKTTWEDLEKRELVNASYGAGRVHANPLANAFFTKETDN